MGHTHPGMTTRHYIDCVAAADAQTKRVSDAPAHRVCRLIHVETKLPILVSRMLIHSVDHERKQQIAQINTESQSPQASASTNSATRANVVDTDGVSHQTVPASSTGDSVIKFPADGIPKSDQQRAAGTKTRRGYRERAGHVAVPRQRGASRSHMASQNARNGAKGKRASPLLQPDRSQLPKLRPCTGHVRRMAVVVPRILRAHRAATDAVHQGATAMTIWSTRTGTAVRKPEPSPTSPNSDNSRWVNALAPLELMRFT